MRTHLLSEKYEDQIRADQVTENFDFSYAFAREHLQTLYREIQVPVLVGIGEYLTQLLNAKGIETIHDTGVYDIINGQLDRSNAYENAEASVRPILEANPSDRSSNRSA